ncbi:ATP-binding protein [Psychrobacillus glaciei]|uniref:ATP-binding protein n=1 Tax=Psychrobacillus glaciei TaxID=2283160 RepID=UPI00124BD276|nr:ATP-binding protein [Psychrobacillus glaciei]
MGDVVLAEYKYKKKFEHIFQSYSSGLIFINEKGEILEVNSKIEEIFQTKRNELCGMNALQLLESLDESFENKKAFIQTVLQDGNAELFSELQNSLGELKYIRIRVSKQKDTKLYLTEIHDESEKMTMKKRLDHSESLSTLGQLAASIAHEIRNPMTSLKGFTQLLYKTANEDGKRYLTVINDEIKRMEEILTEFLEVSKPTNNKFYYFEVKDLIEEVVNFMTPQAIMNNINQVITFRVDENRKILGDRNLLKQVFINAIKNAIEAMPKGGNISINVMEDIKHTDDKFICISIEDQGHGIEEKNLEKIFDPFFSTKNGGTGLGLPHIYKVIESHGGTIVVDSSVGKGTIFKLILPSKVEIKPILTI